MLLIQDGRKSKPLAGSFITGAKCLFMLDVSVKPVLLQKNRPMSFKFKLLSDFVEPMLCDTILDVKLKRL